MHAEIERRLEVVPAWQFTHLRAGEFSRRTFARCRRSLPKGALFLPMEDARIASVDVGDIAEVPPFVLTNLRARRKIYPSPSRGADDDEVAAKTLGRDPQNHPLTVNVTPEMRKSAARRECRLPG